MSLGDCKAVGTVVDGFWVVRRVGHCNKGVHFVVLHSVMEDDFWTERGLTPTQRMQTVAGLDNGIQSRFKVGAEQRSWLDNDLRPYSNDAPIIVFSHSPLYKYYRPWNFWTDDAEDVQAILARFSRVAVVHGHTQITPYGARHRPAEGRP
jgi:3',5'-cyclic-AMP phosphodiesterase